MAKLHVEVSMVDDHGEVRLQASLEQPSRFNVDTDPLWVYSRLESMCADALTLVHDQALQISAARRT